MTAISIFVLTYAGIALGKVPGLALDRTGIALMGAIAMVALGVVTPGTAAAAVDLPTILLLYGLMILSAQLRLGGFYTWCASKIVPLAVYPKRFLLAVMTVSAVLSALLANDIVCFAFTPVLTASLIRAGLNPVPFLLGLAVSSNIGSAATLIGNPQNMLIGQVGRLDFADFFFWCAPPALAALSAAYLVIIGICGGRWRRLTAIPVGAGAPDAWPALDVWQTAKGLSAVLVLVGLFLTDIPREIAAVTVAGVLLCSRKMKTRSILGLVDWHLITLFCALFVVVNGISQSGWLEASVNRLSALGVNLTDPATLGGTSVLLSNLVSNVPAVMLLLRFLDPAVPAQWYTLAVSSTFAGNLILLGSIANLIVVEQAAAFGVRISFRQHAAVGVPVTVASLAALYIWM